MKALILASAFLLLSSVASAQAHQAVLSWAASPSTGVTGYHIYRANGLCTNGMSLTTFTLLGSTAGLTYIDATVKAGSSYCYALTATTATGESRFNLLGIQLNKESSK
jgi:opacity protein-like surface antigen